MKYLIMKCQPWHLPQRSRLIGVAAAMLFFVLSAQSQTDAILPPIGGRGGSQFVARCPQGQLLTGFELVTGDDVDSIRPICVIAYGPAQIGPRDQFPQALPYLSRHPLVCPMNTPIVTGMYVRSEGRATVVVNNIHLFCGMAAASQTQSQFPAAVFDGPTHAWEGTKGTQRCPPGLVAVGIHGKSGVWLDSVGLICGAPALTARAPEPGYIALGRVKPSTGVQSISICDSARQARARNSPAAPGLEAQCRAARDAAAAKGKVKLGDLTLEAHAVDSKGIAPALYRLEKPIDADVLAARGEALTNADPLAGALRNQEPEGPSRRGFYIGMAAAEGHTAPGPGKQKTHDSLSPAEQAGFNTAVSFSLQRNQNADYALKGVIIANRDPIVAEARNAEKNVFYWLGFNITTGIFGDPALGALGNTATGTGSLKIRNSLNAAGQRGFDDSVKLHLSRKYKP